MSTFRLRPLETSEANTETLACWELLAFFRGSSSVSDLEIDKVQAAAWYVDNIIERSQRDDYRAEPQMAEDEMLDSFSHALEEMARDRAKALEDYYPLTISAEGFLTRRSAAELSSVGLSYLVLQFFRALSGGLIEFEETGSSEAKTATQHFHRIFRNIFEYIAGYAVAGDKSGDPYMLSDCRSSEKLHRILELISSRIKAGRVARYEDWNELQKQANDGGVDCLVHVGAPAASGSSYIVLVGATAQKSSIKHKIIGRDQREFFGKFFVQKPAAFQGALVRPLDEDELTKAKCVEQDCLLYSYESIWRGMAKKATSTTGLLPKRRLDVAIRSLLNEFSGTVFKHEYEQFNVPSA